MQGSEKEKGNKKGMKKDDEIHEGAEMLGEGMLGGTEERRTP